jgi:hypothetical protein
MNDVYVKIVKFNSQQVFVVGCFTLACKTLGRTTLAVEEA